MDQAVTTVVIVGMVGGFALVGRVLKQSVDATAIEVERLGEGLRFTTKLLADRNAVQEPQR